MLIRKIVVLGCAILLVGACEGASEVQKGATDYDNADRDAMQKQTQEMQQKADEAQRQQDLMQLQDCQNTPFLIEKDPPVRASDAGFWTAMFAADMQLAWGSGGGGGGGRAGGGGKGGRSNNCP